MCTYNILTSTTERKSEKNSLIKSKPYFLHVITLLIVFGHADLLKSIRDKLELPFCHLTLPNECIEPRVPIIEARKYSKCECVLDANREKEREEVVEWLG